MSQYYQNKGDKFGAKGIGLSSRLLFFHSDRILFRVNRTS